MSLKSNIKIHGLLFVSKVVLFLRFLIDLRQIPERTNREKKMMKKEPTVNKIPCILNLST